MIDWKVGQKVVCIRDRACGCGHTSISKGTIYEIKELKPHPDIYWSIGVRVHDNEDGGYWDSRYFRPLEIIDQSVFDMIKNSRPKPADEDDDGGEKIREKELEDA
jgi:hypothetical protein